MQALKRKGIIALAVVGMFATSGLASAGSHSTEVPDTDFEYSFNAETGELSWDTSTSVVTISGLTISDVTGDAAVAGPNDQINHGMIMKAFNSSYEGQGRGCLKRHLAQSDFGKGETTGVVTGSVDCEYGQNGNGSGPEFLSEEPGRPDSPGKSGDAPGHNKPS